MNSPPRCVLNFGEVYNPMKHCFLLQKEKKKGTDYPQGCEDHLYKQVLGGSGSKWHRRRP